MFMKLYPTFITSPLLHFNCFFFILIIYFTNLKLTSQLRDAYNLSLTWRYLYHLHAKLKHILVLEFSQVELMSERELEKTAKN